MKESLTLHEAIKAVLQDCTDRTARIDYIADEINRLKFYKRKDGEPLPAFQVMQRTKLSNGRYHKLFEFIEPDLVRLR